MRYMKKTATVRKRLFAQGWRWSNSRKTLLGDKVEIYLRHPDFKGLTVMVTSGDTIRLLSEETE